jgi:hypothetical protein
MMTVKGKRPGKLYFHHRARASYPIKVTFLKFIYNLMLCYFVTITFGIIKQLLMFLVAVRDYESLKKYVFHSRSRLKRAVVNPMIEDQGVLIFSIIQCA